MKRNIVTWIIVLCTFLSTQAFSQSNDSLEKLFVMGNIIEKTQLISSANEDGEVHTELWNQAFSFINTNYNLLSDSEDFITLARTVVQKSSLNNLDSLLEPIKNLFTITDEPAIILDLLAVFSSITVENDEIVILVNSYALSLLEQGSDTNKDMLYLTLEVLGNFASPLSFPVLFQAYAYGNDKEISDIALSSLIQLESGNENQIRSLIENGNPSEKYYTLQIVLKNSKNSDFFKAEMSEKALASTIILTDDVSTVDDFTVNLQMEAMRELQRISWTRSASLITDYYIVAKKQFEAGFLDEVSFVEVIQAFTALSSSNAGQHLAAYLEEINKLQEENIAYSESVVLSVIQSLGLLGDKVAFDALLYTTYLEYPENIILAARDALVALKW